MIPGHEDRTGSKTSPKVSTSFIFIDEKHGKKPAFHGISWHFMAFHGISWHFMAKGTASSPRHFAMKIPPHAPQGAGPAEFAASRGTAGGS